MATHLALLRGINVGGRNKVPMAELRGVVTSLGHTGVTTYIQSGNVLFTTDERDTGKLASDLEAAITGSFGLKSSVVVLAREDLAWILDRNPYPNEPNPKLVHVVFLNGEPPAALLDRITAARRVRPRPRAAATPSPRSARRCTCTRQTASAPANWPRWSCGSPARRVSRPPPETGPRPPSC